MQDKASFAEVLDAASMLSLDEQQTLVEMLQRRMADNSRAELANDIQEAQQEFQSGGCSATLLQLMGE